MNSDDYCLPEGYISNPECTFDNGDKMYWNNDRISSALSYQAAVYKWAERLILEKDLKSIIDVGCGCGAKLSRIQQTLTKIGWGGLLGVSTSRMQSNIAVSIISRLFGKALTFNCQINYHVEPLI